MKLVLVRHVETYGNVGHLLNGHTESDYTPRGVAMKELLIKELIVLDQKLAFDKIYASPTSRALKIAQEVGLLTGKEIQVDPRLREFNFGIFEGKTRDQCIELFPEEWDHWMANYNDYLVPQGQSQREYHELCANFLAELAEEETVLIIAHGGTIHSMLTNMLNLPLDCKWHFDVKLGSVTIIDYSHGFGMLSHMSTPSYELLAEKTPLTDNKKAAMRAAARTEAQAKAAQKRERHKQKIVRK